MDILRVNSFIKKNKKIRIKKENGILKINNPTNNEATIIIPRIYVINKNSVSIKLYGSVIKGDNGVLVKLVNRKGQVVNEIGLNTDFYSPRKARFIMIAFRMMPNSEVEISKFDMDFLDNYEDKLKENLNSDTVFLVPGYPSLKQKYNFTFVHSKLLEYKKKGMNFDVLSVNYEDFSEKYEFEGINVCKTDYLNARDILQERKYRRIIVHFFMEQYANILDSIDISNSRVFIYAHGADLIYRDYNIMTARYFENPLPINSDQMEEFKRRDKIINRYNEKTNVKWIFGTNWAKERVEKLNNIKFKNVEIIPCIINEKVFEYKEKNEEDRKKVFILKKFDNCNTYAIDIAVRAIIELSKRECFNNLEFNIYGDGTEHDRLLEPLTKFNNVNIYKGFLTHEEISKAHKSNGIALFPTRYETQGVSALEAVMSGLVVITGNVAAVPESFDSKFDVLCEKENYMQYADKIEYLYNNPKEFCRLSKEMYEDIKNKYKTDDIIDKEMKMFDNDTSLYWSINIPEKEETILTIAVASYNVEKYLRNGILSLLKSKVASNLEILIINDGSKDNTAAIGKELEDLSTKNGKSIVKLIDKENGGHGSAINKGIELATGKYFKLMDGDDYFDTEELEKLVNYLKNEDVDMVLNNYVEDLAVYSIKRVKSLYDFMIPGLKYYIEDLCDSIYGFNEWGPLLSTSTFKTKMLKDANFKISEKCFYVDMELNTYAFINAKTIMYYPLDLYVYFLGRSGQSVSQESYTKNYKNHEHVTLKLIEEYYNNKNITINKKEYILNKIILPLVKCQYMVTTEFLNNSVGFKSFDHQLKKYSEIYNMIKGKRIKIHRITNGHLIRLIKFIDKVKQKLRRD